MLGKKDKLHLGIYKANVTTEQSKNPYISSKYR